MQGFVILPIDKEEWNRGRTWETVEGQVEVFLSKNGGRAFTQFEIAIGLGRISQGTDLGSFLGDFASLWVVGNALQNLIKEGKVKAKVVKKEIGEETYYMASP